MIPADCCRPFADTSPSQLSRSTRAPLLRWKCATGSSARPRRRPLAAADSARTAAAAARATPRRSRDRSCQSGRSSSAQRASASPAPCRAKRLDRRRLGRQQQIAGRSTVLRSSQARKPGIGDKVAKVLSRGSSAASASTTRLIRKSPKLMPGEAALAVRDRIEDRRVGGLRIADRRRLVEQRMDVARHAANQRHLDKDQRLVRHARVEKRKAAAVGLEPVLQIGPAADFVHRLVGHQLFEQRRRRIPR